MSDGTPSAAAKLLNRPTTPRALILTEDDRFAEQLADEVFPTSHRLTTTTPGLLNVEVQQAEYDMLVTTQAFVATFGQHVIRAEPAAHLSVIAFGVERLGRHVNYSSAQELPLGATLLEGSVARELQLPAAVPAEFEQLVRSDLLPVVMARQGPHPVLELNAETPAAADCTPLLETTEGKALAGLFPRAGDGAGLVLALPPDVKDRVGWVCAALKYFRARWPERYEAIPGWEERDEWSTATERELRETLRSVEAERERVVAELDARADELRLQLTEATVQAEEGRRQLLTGKGETLVTEVSAALRSIGLAVFVVDEDADPNNKLEDLRVTDPGDESWEVLVEVRSYARGASLKDLMRLGGRFVKRYFDEQGRWPSALWYVVNQFAGRDPDLRQPVLSSQPDELEEWAEEWNGLAIDTSDLFQLVTAVERGELDPADARRRLRSAQVRYEFSGDAGPANATVAAGSEQELHEEIADDDEPLAGTDAG